MAEIPDARASIASLFDEAVPWRRTLHSFPQPSWTEFFATGFVAERLDSWGYRVLLGSESVDPDRRVAVPPAEQMDEEYARAIEAGTREEYISPARGGLTGAVGILDSGRPGPTVAFRFDIDSNVTTESADPSHRPVAEGFVSRYPGYAHMCGHDAHTATGLLLARYFSEHRESLRGRVKFLFQPAEEDLAGAAPMVAKGHLDDVDYLFGAHVGLSLGYLGQIALNVHSFLALSRFEVTYTGRAAHSGLRPNEGRNALLGACAAVTNLHAIARHGEGASRVNVGTLEAGTTWNVVPDRAVLRMETRGVTNEINRYMVDRAREVLEGAARMYDLGLDIKPGAAGLSATNFPEMVEVGTRVARTLPWVTEVAPEAAFNASEDVTLMMDHVERRGGKALFAMVGTPTLGGHHSSTFDLDERVIRNGAEFFVAMYAAVTEENQPYA